MIKKIDVVDGKLAEDAWDVYLAAFEDLGTRAVQRHVMYPAEFTDVMTDKRIEKWLLLDDDDALVGIGAVTTDLRAVPLISAAYFEHHFPRRFAAGHIWWVLFLAVPEHHQGSFAELVGEMYRAAASANGLVGLDMCAYNEEILHMARVIGLMVSRLSGGESSFEQLDSQRYWLYNVTGKDPR